MVGVRRFSLSTWRPGAGRAILEAMKQMMMLFGAGAALVLGADLAAACPGPRSVVIEAGPTFGPLVLARVGGAALLVMAAAMVEVVAFLAIRKFVSMGNPVVVHNATEWSRRGLTQGVAIAALFASVACSVKVGLTPILMHGTTELWTALAAVWFGALAGTAAGAVMRRGE